MGKIKEPIMKYIKLFEELNIENVKKYPYLFNMFVDPKYIKEEDYEVVNGLLKKYDIKTPLFINNKLFDTKGDVILLGFRIEKLPDNLTINGNLSLSDSNFEPLPNNLEVKKNLYLDNSSVNYLPDNLKVGGDLNLKYCSNLKKLPKNLQVGGNLFIGHTNITEIPSDIKVGGKIIR